LKPALKNDAGVIFMQGGLEIVTAALRKRSVLLAGHATSIALEPEFWAVLEAMAEASSSSLAAVIARIDAGRGERPLASACRVAALRFAQLD
jgi:predicted DNA-binding ribbon-helix-helix protein